ncbi:FeoA family protein [Mollicutes bacterium LVI A0039]|nr:FeoA family protein [Mollicutes bacterium LVI A0039]
MKLSEVKQNTYLKVENILYENAQEEIVLNNYGLIIGESIRFIKLNSFKKAYYISIGDSQFYINEPLAKRIEVSYE